MSDENQIAPTEEESIETRPPRSAFFKIILIFFVLGMALLFSVFGYGYFQLSRINLSLAKQLQAVGMTAKEAQTKMTNLDNTVKALQEAKQKTQEQLMPLEQTVSELRGSQKGDTERWQAAEAQYLVKLANAQLTFNQNPALALTILQNADQILQPLSNSLFQPIRQALSNDIAALRAIPAMDVDALFARLSEVNSRIDRLPLPNEPVKSEPVNRMALPKLSWWKTSLNQTWETLQKIVVIRRNTANALPLVLPEEKLFLYQNLHAQVEGAMWGLLHHNQIVYQASLLRAIAWIQQYFPANSNEVKVILENLQALEKINVNPTLPQITNSLVLFQNYFSAVPKL